MTFPALPRLPGATGATARVRNRRFHRFLLLGRDCGAGVTRLPRVARAKDRRIILRTPQWAVTRCRLFLRLTGPELAVKVKPLGSLFAPESHTVRLGEG